MIFMKHKHIYLHVYQTKRKMLYNRVFIKIRNQSKCSWLLMKGDEWNLPQCPSVYMLRHTFSLVPQLLQCNLFAFFHIP